MGVIPKEISDLPDTRDIYIAAILISCFAWAMPKCDAQQTKKPFSVADEIGLTLFDPPSGGSPELHFSPDGNYFAVWTERGRSDMNSVEDSLRFYRTQIVENFLKHPDQPQPPSPVWIVDRSDREGPVISKWRWLADSSGVAFLEREANGSQRLVLANLPKKIVEPLTSGIEIVEAFDIRDRQHYVYTAADPAEWKKLQAESQVPATVSTGRKIDQWLFRDDIRIVRYLSHKCLWAFLSGKRFEVRNGGMPLDHIGNFALSPDGGSIVATLPILQVPSSWETLFPAPFASDPFRIGASGRSVQQYVRINLKTGSVQSLTDAPVGTSAGWEVLGGPSWSSDGRAVLLPGTFLNSKDYAPSRPCVTVVDLDSGVRSCVEALKGRTETGVEEGYHMVLGARFASGDKQRVIVSFLNHQDGFPEATEYRCLADDSWQVAQRIKGEPPIENSGLELTVKQSLNEAPHLVASYKQVSRVIWDPNPQLKDIALGEASVYKWKDKEGREWKAGLYKPVNYQPGRRYPLVIQTHGFDELLFKPSGVFPTAFAARALAAAEILVLQVDTHCLMGTRAEGPCAASEYEAAANQLVSEGLADPENIGIIGFSRTCFYVMETATTGSVHLKAASITDGFLEDYFQYLMFDDVSESDSMIGAKPFGEGLQQWLKLSPGFNLDKLTAPLLIVGGGPASLLSMWQPYAGLRDLHKPVDLIMLNMENGNGTLPYEHVLTNPGFRMASQGGSVDWFRFWLQDFEDPNPAKREQYTRWRELRKMQGENEKKSAVSQRFSN